MLQKKLIEWCKNGPWMCHFSWIFQYQLLLGHQILNDVLAFNENDASHKNIFKINASYEQNPPIKVKHRKNGL